MYIYIYTYIYVYIYTYVYMCIYIYSNRELDTGCKKINNIMKETLNIDTIADS